MHPTLLVSTADGFKPHETVVALTVLVRQHPTIDTLIAVIVFVAALSVVGSAIWLAVTTSRRNRRA